MKDSDEGYCEVGDESGDEGVDEGSDEDVDEGSENGWMVDSERLGFWWWTN